MLTLCIAMLPSSSLPTYAWGSNEDISKQTAHTFIVEQGLKIVLSDLSEADRQNPALMAVLEQFQTEIDTLKRGAVAPDFGSKTYSVYQDHFYDPYTKQNFTSLSNSISTGVLDYVFPTAMYRSKEYTGNALQLWNAGDTTSAVFEFGKGMHYFADICEPHHASNAIGGTEEPSTKHSAFENYADTVVAEHAITTTGTDTTTGQYTNYTDQVYFSDFINTIGDAYGKDSQRLYYDVFRASDRNTWSATAKPALTNAQTAVAQVIYRFAKEVSNPDSVNNHNTSTTLSLDVRVKTSSGSVSNCYGTDNNVYFGVELKNGRTVEWALDKSGYNDHENGDNDTYTVTLEKAAGNDIHRAWIRKQRGWQAGTAEDNWHLAEVEINSNDGQLQLLKPINQWLKGNIDLELLNK